MGILFIAAGSASDNRTRSLDHSLPRSSIAERLGPLGRQKLESHFGETEPVFVWGATQKSFGAIRRMRRGDFAVDLKNRRVMQVLRFCFFIDTGSDNTLQDFIGWDQGRRSTERPRRYRYVYFLRDPRATTREDKAFFLDAFGKAEKPHFFDSQKYIDDEQIAQALLRTRCESLEEFLGVRPEGTRG